MFDPPTQMTMAALTEHVVTYDGGAKKISYVAAGPPDGPLLIFLHGWVAIGKTWISQLTTFSALGFRVVAPDMPGYGKSTSNKVYSDYSQESIIQGVLALLADTGRQDAVWVAHDWGAVVLVAIGVPYRSVELGLDEVRQYVNREKYPEDEYPYGQWSYQIFYEQHFAEATAWFDEDAPAALRMLFLKTSLSAVEKPSPLASVAQDGGWKGGSPRPPPKSEIPSGRCSLDGLPQDIVREFEDDMTRTGFFGANAYYMNHAANRKYILDNTVNEVLEIPVLFVAARYEAVCDTINTRIAEPMERLCKDLTFTYIDAGHWVLLEKPEETNAAIARWLVEKMPTYWPGYWSNVFAGNKV
nr:epoxide hydrolase a [Quercus suber]